MVSLFLFFNIFHILHVNEFSKTGGIKYGNERSNDGT